MRLHKPCCLQDESVTTNLLRLRSIKTRRSVTILSIIQSLNKKGMRGLHDGRPASFPPFLTLIDRACRVMSGNKSFAAFGRHLRRPAAPSPWARTRSTLLPRHSAAQHTFFTLVHSFIPPLGVVPPRVPAAARQTSPESPSFLRRPSRSSPPDPPTNHYGILPPLFVFPACACLV